MGAGAADVAAAAAADVAVAAAAAVVAAFVEPGEPGVHFGV